MQRESRSQNIRQVVSTTVDDRHLTVAGLSAYVEVLGNDELRRVVLCRACGFCSPSLTRDREIDWFEQHAAEDYEEHHRARSKSERAWQ
jgi:hypothetical protein